MRLSIKRQKNLVKISTTLSFFFLLEVPMFTGIDTEVIPKQTESLEVKDILQAWDIQINDVILSAFLHGFYTGVMSIALWTIVQSKYRLHGRGSHFLIVVILLLYAFATVEAFDNWMFLIQSLVPNDVTNSWATCISNGISRRVYILNGLIDCLSTIFADTSLAWSFPFHIWRCWTAWGRSWRAVVVPIICTTVAVVSRFMVLYGNTMPCDNGLLAPGPFLLKSVNWAMLYSSLVLATLLWCTILIIYRILRVSGVVTGIRLYYRAIEVIVDSASLYSAVMVVLLVFGVRNERAVNYLETVASEMRGIVPTILVGRVAAGHTRPDDGWGDSRSAVSSLEFENQPISQDNTTQMNAEDNPSLRATVLDMEEGLEEITHNRHNEMAGIA
ncbi:hypothetical protein ARMSODRAFT_999086 [Armillaria solidipes]|uniref:Uncharacterized protein n=1 Tax=Armillaria solidipes TaxID=1076256 RepID=A0A2H3CDV3_9AGAR|nr:hypothetical protein ARMSODRAFT_999086 [Armillaria solidipes]